MLAEYDEPRALGGRGSESLLPSGRRSSRSSATSTTARRRCSTRSARPNVVDSARAAASRNTSAPTQVVHGRQIDRPSWTPPATRRSPPCVPAGPMSPTSSCWSSPPTTASCRRPRRPSPTRRPPACRSSSRSTRSTFPTSTSTRSTASCPSQDLVPEEYGGDTPVVKTSALSGQGIPDLLEMIGDPGGAPLRVQAPTRTARPPAPASKRRSPKGAGWSRPCSCRTARSRSAT